MQDVDLQEVEQQSVSGKPVVEKNLEYLKDVDVMLEVRVGKTQLTVGELFKLTEGSVLKLEQLANESVDLLLKGNVVARGRLTVVDDHFGVEVTEVNQD